MASGLFTGLVLLSIIPIYAIAGVAYYRAEIGGKFWGLPLQDKLGHLLDHRHQWLVIRYSWVAVMIALMAGIVSLLSLQFDSRVIELAWIAVAIHLIVSLLWTIGFLMGSIGVSVALEDQESDDVTVPAWLRPIWSFMGVTEVIFVVGASISYVLLGIALVISSSPWMGWTVLGLGVVVLGYLAAVRMPFPELPFLAALVLGIGLVIAAI